MEQHRLATRSDFSNKALQRNQVRTHLFRKGCYQRGWYNQSYVCSPHLSKLTLRHTSLEL